MSSLHENHRGLGPHSDPTTLPAADPELKGEPGGLDSREGTAVRLTVVRGYRKHRDAFFLKDGDVFVAKIYGHQGQPANEWANILSAAPVAWAVCQELIHGGGTPESLQRAIDLSRIALDQPERDHPEPMRGEMAGRQKAIVDELMKSLEA